MFACGTKLVQIHRRGLQHSICQSPPINRLFAETLAWAPALKVSTSTESQAVPAQHQSSKLETAQSFTAKISEFGPGWTPDASPAAPCTTVTYTYAVTPSSWEGQTYFWSHPDYCLYLSCSSCRTCQVQGAILKKNKIELKKKNTISLYKKMPSNQIPSHSYCTHAITLVQGT